MSAADPQINQSVGALGRPGEELGSLLDRIFADIGGVELDIPSWDDPARFASFE